MRHAATRIALAAATALFVIATAHPAAPLAQRQPEKMPPRPRLEAGKDTNDWRSYYWYGVQKLTRGDDGAIDAFHWASRLDPSAPEPYYGRGLALLTEDPERFIKFMYGVEYVVKSDEVREADSLLYEAKRRNPFMQGNLDQQTVEAVISRYVGRLVWLPPDLDAESQAYKAYNAGMMGLAAQKFGEAARNNPKRLTLRVMRAHALAMGGDADSAAAELTRVIAEMRKRDQKKLVSFYESKAQFEYEIGMIYGRAGNIDAAKEAFGRALSEDLTFYQAHLRLAELAMSHNDTTTALAEFDQAAQLRPNDGMVRFEYGVALLRAKKFAEGEAQLRKATELEPYFATGYYDLALALDLQGKKREAIAPYKTFAALAPQTAQTQIETAKARATEYATLDVGAATKP